MNKEVKFLNISSVIFKVLAWVSVAFFVVVSVIVVLGRGGDTPRVASIVFLLGGGVYFLVLFTIAQVLSLLIKMAEKSGEQAGFGAGADVSAQVMDLSKKVDRLSALLEGKPTS